jgi:predicted DCC family thiol-disulfide oxidoreductase YuxK
LLEQLDQGQQFRYVPMQDATLEQIGITPGDCEQGIILLHLDPLHPEQQQRWQGTAAAEEIGRLLPLGYLFVEAYRALPGVKWMGDRVYEQVRDNRYKLFGKRDSTYWSLYPGLSKDDPQSSNSQNVDELT